MAITAQSVIHRVVDTIQDSTSVRWPVNELVRYLNDGQREIVLYRPDAVRKPGSVILKAGARQKLPSDGTKLIEFWSNTGGNKRAVRLIDREILDAQSPGWQKVIGAGATEILHYMYDIRIPTEFFVYPAAAAGASLEGAYSAMPLDIVEPADLALYTEVGLVTDTRSNATAAAYIAGLVNATVISSVVDGPNTTTTSHDNISVPDIYGNLLQSYIQYRVWNKDAGYAGNAARSQTEYAIFTGTLAAELAATTGVAPKSAANPNSV